MRKQWMSIVRVKCRRKWSVDRNLWTEIVDRRRKWKCPHHPSLLRLNNKSPNNLRCRCNKQVQRSRIKNVCSVINKFKDQGRISQPLVIAMCFELVHEWALHEWVGSKGPLFVLEISLVCYVHSFDFTNITDSCENLVRTCFPWKNLYLYIDEVLKARSLRVM